MSKIWMVLGMALMAVGLLGLLLRTVRREQAWAWASLLILGTNGVFVFRSWKRMSALRAASPASNSSE